MLVNNSKASTTKTPSLTVSIGGYSSAGLKAENQDAFAALTPKAAEISAKGAVAVIADGVSSASNAAQASQLSVTQFISDYYGTPATWSTQKSASKVLSSLNQWLFSQDSQLTHHQQSGLHQSQQWLTTFSAIILKSTSGYIFHVGDSRISQYRQQKLDSITRDHNHKQGSKHVVLTRALGADSRLKVDFHKVDLQVNDIYLLTCDGVHDFISQETLKKHLNQLPEKPTNNDLEHTSQIIVQDALEQGSDDNLSCLLVHVASMPNRNLDEIERDLLSKAIPPALKEGMMLDGYKVRKIIYQSNRSHLYLVENEAAQADIAKTDKNLMVLKVPSHNFSDDTLYLQGFKREAWVGERIDHANVMKIRSASPNSKFLYHLCEYIDGQTLTQWMQDNPKPNIDQVRKIISQIIAALRVFQRLELVHRDLKSDNIMIDQLGQVKIIDYGTVKVASLLEDRQTINETVPLGTMNYTAPETLLTLQADNRSDLFSLGVICYEMLCGQLPYKPMKHSGVQFEQYSQWQYLSIKQYRPELPLWLDLALRQATNADPESRYQSFSEFQTDLNKPNISAVEQFKTQPLLQRDPVKFWQTCSLILFFLLMVSLFQ